MAERTLPEQDTASLRNGMVHFILSHSYVIFLLAVILGAVSHTILDIRVFSDVLYEYIGFFMIVAGSGLIYWAQSTSSCTRREVKKGQVSERDFERGPYKYSRSPTHNGLAIMTLGLGLVVNSLFIFIYTIIAIIITKVIFLREEEMLLEKKYGEIYCDYKRKVRSWL